MGVGIYSNNHILYLDIRISLPVSATLRTYILNSSAHGRNH